MTSYGRPPYYLKAKEESEFVKPPEIPPEVFEVARIVADAAEDMSGAKPLLTAQDPDEPIRDLLWSDENDVESECDRSANECIREAYRRGKEGR